MAGCGGGGPSEGELGLVRFVWTCGDTPDDGCGEEEFPDAIAVGASFEASFEYLGDDAGVRSGADVVGASPSLVGPAGGGSGLAALAAGDVALMAMRGGTMIDFTMVELVEVSRIGLRTPARTGSACGDDDDDDDDARPCEDAGPILDDGDRDASFMVVELEPSSVLTVEAVPLRDSSPLAGRLEYAWHSEDPERLSVTPRSDGAVWLNFRGPWAVVLEVTAGEVSQTILVRAPGSDEVPDPLRSGGRS